MKTSVEIGLGGAAAARLIETLPPKTESKFNCYVVREIFFAV